MRLKIFKKFIKEALKEGNRLQKIDLLGNLYKDPWYANTKGITLFVAIALSFCLSTGFTDNFAGYLISFFGIFIGLFTSIVISLTDKSKEIFTEYDKKTENEKVHLKKVRNYIVQFTGLTSYSILLAIGIIILLFFPLLDSHATVNIYRFRFVDSIKELNWASITKFLSVGGLLLYRFTTFYLIIYFFIITIFAITSYFSFILSEQKKLGDKL